VLIIPQNYTDDLLAGKNPMIEVKKTQDGYSTYMELMLERFIKIVDIYSKTGMNQDEICQYIKNDLKQEAKITIDSNLDVSMYSKIKQYYNFSNYVFLSLCILIISEIMASFKDEKIKRRNLTSATPFKKISIQVFMGNVSIVILIWAFYVAISILLYKSIMLSKIGLLLMINSFVFTITSSAIGFLIATIVKKREAINGIVNVVALGLSFISGAFVPQKYLGNTVLGIAKIFPSYWFIINNSKIVEINEFGFNSLKPVIANMGIIASYVIIIFAIIGIYNKYRERSGG
jgi:ABC-2 type transport system permease protein